MNIESMRARFIKDMELIGLLNVADTISGADFPSLYHYDAVRMLVGWEYSQSDIDTMLAERFSTQEDIDKDLVSGAIYYLLYHHHSQDLYEALIKSDQWRSQSLLRIVRQWNDVGNSVLSWRNYIESRTNIAQEP